MDLVDMCSILMHSFYTEFFGKFSITVLMFFVSSCNGCFVDGHFNGIRFGFVKDLANEGAPHQSTQAQGRKKNLNVQHAFVSAQSTTELLKWVCSMSWFSSRTSEEILDEVGK